jgi:hypothetical protein
MAQVKTASAQVSKRNGYLVRSVLAIVYRAKKCDNDGTTVVADNVVSKKKTSARAIKKAEKNGKTGIVAVAKDAVGEGKKTSVEGVKDESGTDKGENLEDEEDVESVVAGTRDSGRRSGGGRGGTS